MSSEDKNRDNMDADSGDEVSETSEREETSDELFAMGNDPRHNRNGAADSEKEISATLRTEDSSAFCGSKTNKNCSCNSSRQTRFKTFGTVQIMRCMLCGGVINGSRINLAQINKPVASLTGMEGPLIGAGSQSYAAGLPMLPSISLEDNSSEQEGGSYSSHRPASLVTGRSREEKIPVQNVCEIYVQTPSPGMKVIMFLFERTHQERNEKWYILYIIPETDFKVYETIYIRYVNEAEEATSQEGYKTRQIPFAVDNARSQEFHTVFVQEEITVSFEIQNYQLQENFETQDAGQERVFRVPVICCESQNRVTPGANSQFRVQCVGRPGTLCQEQGKIMLTIDKTMQHSLFFSISVWVPDG